MTSITENIQTWNLKVNSNHLRNLKNSLYQRKFHLEAFNKHSSFILLWFVARSFRLHLCWCCTMCIARNSSFALSKSTFTLSFFFFSLRVFFFINEVFSCATFLHNLKVCRCRGKIMRKRSCVVGGRWAWGRWNESFVLRSDRWAGEHFMYYYWDTQAGLVNGTI